MVKRLHHLNFIVRDLESATAIFSTLFDLSAGPVEELPGRGVRLSRFQLGETWIILVQPTNPDSAPGRYLADQGEGFFLASFEVDDLEQSLQRLAANGIQASDEPPRSGLEDWQVVDLDAEAFAGIGVQLVQAGGKDE